MRIAIHDADAEHLLKGKASNKFPNLALMKISAWHKKHGDFVEWWQGPMVSYDKVYSSKVFDFTPENPYLPSDTIKGGTGYGGDISRELPSEIDAMYPDYSIYPDCDYAVGFLTRGCPNHCPWCYVPAKEGNIRPYRSWRQIVRSDTDKLVLMDNNILACEYGVAQLADMIGSGYQIDLNQGMDARLVTPEVADILARLDWIRFLRFSCDQCAQIEPVCRAIELLSEYGVKSYKIFVYVLVRKDVQDAAYRVECLKRYPGISLYGMPERNEALGIVPNREQLIFARRYLYSGTYRKETWAEYKQRSPEY